MLTEFEIYFLFLFFAYHFIEENGRTIQDFELDYNTVFAYYI